MRRYLPLLLTLALVLAAGCSGGDGDEAATATPAVTGASARPPVQLYGQDDPRFGRLLLRFARAAADGDAGTMWRMLTSTTQASIGPSLTEFRKRSTLEFQEGVGSIASTADVLLSRRLGDFGVGAILGEREVDDGSRPFAYAVAFVRDGGGWRIELGGVVITGLRPEPLEEVDARPQLAADVGAGGGLDRVLMWLDGEPFAVAEDDATPFAAHLRGIPDEPLDAGRHEIVVFAEAGPTASALAWTFESG